ncbi:MAG: selenium metabolism-associated LysR family transcriptional regulator [Syntrophomonadaceae bacterium]|nr:selenium metabolism-associated LysR family transcriptional regulator [Syntrophomonadaceae bacterium]MDD3888434.1 selenium metabolism-associated LysR family transcriptional regulator [Syntrophomonadaceae bacterium]MDD4549186.1 selenium metabolism-associated LysR family transcriptional regulator [Syntrophomonadaceae bacterium]
MNLNLFKTYIRVVETQNLSRTAEEFGLSQPAVTKQIQGLEDMYGVLLLERSGRRLKTTEAGETLYNCAKDILKTMEKTEKAMEEVSESRKGSLNLGASTIPGQYILPHIIKKFKDKYPNISISMDIADTEKIFSRVAEREIDVGIVGGWINNRKVEGFQWLEDELVVVVPESHKYGRLNEVNIKDLLNEKWIFREKGSGTRKAVEELMAALGIKKDELNVYMEAGSTEAVLASVESGMGVSIVSRWAIKKVDQHRKIKSLKLAEPDAERYFYIIYPRQKIRRKSVTNFLEYVKKLEETNKAL